MTNASSDGRTDSPTTTQIRHPLFHLGQLVATPGALRTLEDLGVEPLTLIRRHVHGDWGDLCAEDQMANTVAIECGSRIFSSYKLKRTDCSDATETTIWVITEATDGTIGGQRSATTILLPGDY